MTDENLPVQGGNAADQQAEPLKLVLPKDFTRQQLLDALSEDFVSRLSAVFGASNTAKITAQKHDVGPGGSGG